MKAFKVGVNPDTGKYDLKITPFGVDHLEICGPVYDPTIKKVSHSVCRLAGQCGNKLCSKDCYDTDWTLVTKDAYRVVTDYFTIPCGQCIGCRIQKSREWANRMVMELPYSSSSWFITLTYDDDHVPKSEFPDMDGVLHKSLTLKKSDFQRFMKRLRKAFPDCHIRYYAAGEYGDKTMRPHYHAILFNCPLDRGKMEPYGRSREGFTYFDSEILSQVWGLDGVPFGRALATPVSWETCAYVARYCTKKLTGSYTDMYEYYHIEPEFALMSRKPGLGRMWYDEHRSEEELITFIIRISNTNGEPLKFKPPRYFQSLYEVDYPDTCAEVKAIQRKMAADKTALKLSKTDLTYMELLEIEERNFKKKATRLKRGDTDG